jgi:uncharacterized membrane protein YphA (DoxX/SURF4 family)
MSWLLSGFIATMFILAAAGKTFGLDEFGQYLSDLGVPAKARRSAGLAVVVVESSVAVMVWLGLWQPLPALAATAIACGFVGLQVRNVVMRSSGCNCYGTIDRSLHPVLALVRATVLFSAAAVLTVTWSAQEYLAERVVYEVVGVLAGVTVLAIVALINQARTVLDFDRRRNKLMAEVRQEGTTA